MAQGPNTILLKVTDLADKYDEARAGAAGIVPGMLLQKQADGTVVVHATAGGTAGAGKGTSVLVAIEDTFQGRTIDTPYALNDLVRMFTPQNGDEIYLLLATANNSDPSKKLTSAGNGAVKVANGTTDQNIFEPVEPLNNASGSNQRHRAKAL